MIGSVLFGLFVVLLYPTGAVKSLNAALPFVQVDAYAPCLRARGDAYCFVSAKLQGDTSHPLYNALLNHSSNNLTHFDRTNVHRGVCLKTSCQEYLGPNATETVEACLNATMYRDYRLSARVFRAACSEYRERLQLDASDIAFGAVILVLLALNLLGSLYDGFNRQDTIVSRLLSCFAVRRNWQKLVAPASSDPRQRRLLSLSGSRAIMSLVVIMGHASACSHFAVENPDTIEETYNNPVYLLFYRGMEFLHVFTILSAIFLVYNILISAEHVTWRNLHKVLLSRWLRFTPTYALTLFFNATWVRYVGDGPFWKATVGVEANDCRRDWWLHLLYIHNYIDHSRCMIHSWSLAVDMQLTAVGLGIFFLLKSARARKAAIALLLAAGLIAPPAAVYLKNLHPVVIPSPEVLLNWLAHDPTFNNLYKRTHTNLVCYGLGMVLGYIIYNLKDSYLGAEKYKKYRVLPWLLIPLALPLQLLGCVFYAPGPPPLLTSMLYSSGIKLVTGMLMCLLVFLTVVEADTLFSRIHKWRGWTPLCRLSFCVYLLHMGLLRCRAAASHTTVYISLGYMTLQNFVETTILSFLLAVPLFLLVEAPFSQLTGLCFARHLKKRTD